MAHRIDTKSATGTMPAISNSDVGNPGFFTDGDPTAGVPATVVSDDWLNSIQEEQLSIVEAAGLTADKTNNAQMLAAIKLLVPGLIDLSKQALKSDLLAEIQRAEAAEAAIYQLPAWVPLYCPFETAPPGYLPGDGRLFDPVACPQLAAAFTNHRTPATQGLFFRSLDPTNQIDNYDPAENIGRSVLSVEEGSYIVNGAGGGLASAAWIFNQVGLAYSGQDVPAATDHSPQVATVTQQSLFPATPQQYAGYGVSRPKNMSWLVVFRAA